MKKVFVYKTSLMNGTVTMQTGVVAAATRELAERIRTVSIESDKKEPSRFPVHLSDIEEIPVYETEKEIPLPI